MKILKKVFLTIIVLSILFSFNSFAMLKNTNDYVPPSPETEKKYEDRSLNYRWLWLNDDKCVQFNEPENATMTGLKITYSIGALRLWVDYTKSEPEIKTRDTYAGKWSQDEAGIWSFTFDDCTIPVGVTKIDGVLYAFNAFGELKDGYNYWGDLKTAADGLVVSDNAEFLKYLETEYLPECTSHE